jgi:methanogenic corrinoid protein MtbC1
VGEADAYQASSDRLVEAAVQFDLDAVREELANVLTLGPAIAVFERVLAPALTRVGELWHTGQITVAQEHLLSAMVLGRVTQLLELVQPVDSSRRAALACFEEEDHVIGLYGAGLHFAAWGFKSVFLGGRTPPDALARAVTALGVDAVALSVTLAPPAARARSLVDAYADACRGVPWIVGGQGTAGIRRFITARGGIVADATFSDVRRTLEKALREGPGVPEDEPASSRG